MKDIFGFSAKRPPYKVSGVKDGIIQLEKTENWVEKKMGMPWDKYFIYYECRADDNGTVFADRQTRPEYRDKIPNSLKHAPIEQIEAYLLNPKEI